MPFDTPTLLVLLNAGMVGLFALTVMRRRSASQRVYDRKAVVRAMSPAAAPSVARSALELDIERTEHLLAIKEARFGKDHPDVGSSCQIVGQLYMAGGDYDRAESAFHRALSIFEPRFDVDSLSVASIYEDLAMLDERRAQPESAETHWRSALEIRAHRLPSRHPDLIWTAMRLGRQLCKQRNYSSAELVLRTITEANIPHSHDAVLAISSLAVALAEQDKDAEAADMVAWSTALMDEIVERGGAAHVLSEFEIAADLNTGEVMTTVAPTLEPLIPLPERHDAARRSSFLAAEQNALALARSVALRCSLTFDALRSATMAGRALGMRLAARVTEHRPTDGSVRATYSAERSLSDAQRRTFIAVAVVFALASAFAPVATAQLVIAVITALYLASLGFRVHAFWRGLRSPGSIEVTDELARSISDQDLPVYTILVPAYHEPEVIGRLITSLAAIEYPVERLDIKLLLEADDAATLDAARAAKAPAHITIVRVPVSNPRTKPKALNHGLQTARGQFITIYDAEDRPDPLQLRRAVVAFRELPLRVVCLQAKLSYYNADQNLLTRWFTAEYALWFGQLLPGLVHDRAPVPLGGTSNHFRRDALMGLGGWDAYNVTEDADLGIRLHRAGLRTQVLESTTYEEANSDFINWAKQRSRWYKGYLQTWLVHMRDPLRLWEELGPAGFIGFNLFLGGVPFLALANPIFWILTAIWFVAHPALIAALFPAPLYYGGMLCFAFGNATLLYATIVSAHHTGRSSLVHAAVFSPLYWAMMSIAAIKALIQLVSVPSFWEKTVHGLDFRASVDREIGVSRPGAVSS